MLEKIIKANKGRFSGILHTFVVLKLEKKNILNRHEAKGVKLLYHFLL